MYYTTYNNIQSCINFNSLIYRIFKMAITTQDIHATADKLKADGINPTLANIRSALGGGSFTTISEAMKSWRQEHEQQTQLKQVEIPSHLNDRLQALGGELWQTALDIADDRLNKEREALELIKKQSQQEVDEYAESVKLLEDENKDLLQQLDRESEKAEEATSQRDTAVAETNELKLQLATLQGENTAQQKQIDTLIAEREKFALRVEELTIALAKN